jgi:hypothetical protein
MSWLRKIVSTIRSDQAEQAADEVMDVTPTAPCLTAEPALADERTAEEDPNPTGQRRYFVKRGVFVDHEDEVRAMALTGVDEEIPDRGPADLKSIFPKLSLR